VKADFRAAKKAGKKPNFAKQLFAQSSKKLNKLEKSLRKASLKSKKCRRDNSDSENAQESKNCDKKDIIYCMIGLFICKIIWDKKGLCVYHPFEFDYILNLYVLSMCFVRYRSWIVCTVCNAAPMSF
jgi:hypothetical protein